MRRRLVRSLAVAALLCLSSPLDAFAQAATPQPQFSITGFIDTVGTWTQNLSQSDLNFNQNRDHQFYGRNRGRFDIIGQVGEAKGVFGFEIDAYWGQTGFSDTTGIGNGEPCFTTGTGNNVTCGAAGQGAESSFDLNTDTQGSLQVKWLYVEFPLPLVPVPIIARLGAQPFATAATYKLAAYANGDFAGVNLYATFTPTVRAQLTYVALDENLLGKGAFGPVLANTGSVQNKCISSTASVQPGSGVSTNSNSLIGNCFPQSRGDNWAFIVSPEITVMKSLDIKPMFSPVFIDGMTTSAARPGRGGVSNGPGGPFAPINSPDANGSPGVGGADGAGTGTHEYRYTVGVDARWREGPWSVEPTFLYQFGSQTKWNPGGVASAYGTAGTKQTAEISAWLGDVRGSYQLGPVLLSAMSMFTTGPGREEQSLQEHQVLQSARHRHGISGGLGDADRVPWRRLLPEHVPESRPEYRLGQVRSRLLCRQGQLCVDACPHRGRRRDADLDVEQGGHGRRASGTHRRAAAELCVPEDLAVLPAGG